MISKTYINTNLRSLNYRFSKTTSQKEALLYSKLAVLELCGWIEISMDDLVLRCAKDNLMREESFNYIANNIVKKNYGFEYKNHFRNMITIVLGLKTIEQLESLLNPTKYARLTSTLGTLKNSRDNQAHTYIKSTMITVDAPSITQRNFNFVYDGLIEYERVLKAEGFLKTKFLR